MSFIFSSSDLIFSRFVYETDFFSFIKFILFFLTSNILDGSAVNPITHEVLEIFITLSTAETKGGLFVGESGSGHFVKMIHNGIEYGMMQSIAEGLEILKNKTEYNLKLDEITQNWRTGSVVQSWLIDLIAGELKKDSDLGKFSSEVGDSGEGRWTIKESIDLAVPIPSIYASISQRFNSKNKNSYSGKILSAMRNAFGGHTD